MLWDWFVYLGSGIYSLANVSISYGYSVNFRFSDSDYRVSSEVMIWQKVKNQEKYT